MKFHVIFMRENIAYHTKSAVLLSKYERIRLLMLTTCLTSSLSFMHTMFTLTLVLTWINVFFKFFFSAVTESHLYFFCLQVFNPGCNISTQEDITREDQSIVRISINWPFNNMARSDMNDRAAKHKTNVCDVIIASWLQGQVCQGAKSCQAELTEEYKKLLSIQMKNLNPPANV